MNNLIFLVIFVVGALVTIQFLQPATGANTLRQVIEINGTYPAGVDEFNVTISPPLANMDKAVAYLTFNYNQQNQHRDTFRSWNFTDTSTLTIYGNDVTPSNNFAVGFHGTIFEFTADSDVFIQHLGFDMDELLPEGEFELSIPTAVNTSTAWIVPAGHFHGSDDSTVGVEEFTKLRIINSTFYGLEVGDTPNTADTFYHQSIVDYNFTGITVQRGQGTLESAEDTDTVTPSAYNSSNSLLFISYNTNGDFTQDPDDVAVRATINTSTDDIIVQRFDASSNTVDYAWEILEFDDGLATVQHFNGSMADATSLTFETIPTPVTNASRSWAIGTVGSPFGFGNAMSDSIIGGGFDSTTATVTLENATHVELVRVSNDGSFDIGLQVIEFLEQAQTFDQEITDIASAVDQGTQFIVNNTQSDTATVNDNVITALTSNFNATAQDTATTSDDLILNVTKVLSDTATGTDQVQLDITKIVNDTATVLDQVATNQTVVANQTATDTAIIIDLLQINITKTLADTATTSDTVITNSTGLFNATAQDTAIVTDSLITLKTSVFNVTNTETATVTDAVITMLTANKQLLDIVSTSDSIIVTFNTTVISPPTGGGGGGGSNTPSNFQRIQGLSIESELFQVTQSDVVPSDFIITWFGQERFGVAVTEIEPDPEFTSWVVVQNLPQELEHAVEVDNSKVFADPTRVTNIALQPYVLNVPQVMCNVTLDPNIPCFDPILYEIPVDFEFKKGGFPFQTKHTITVDGRSIDGVCIAFGTTTIDEVCSFINYISENWWWLSAVVVVVMVVAIIRARGLAVATGTRKFHRRDLTSLSGERVRKRKKFKKR